MCVCVCVCVYGGKLGKKGRREGERVRKLDVHVTKEVLLTLNHFHEMAV